MKTQCYQPDDAPFRKGQLVNVEIEGKLYFRYAYIREFTKETITLQVRESGALIEVSPEQIKY